jgi:uncharacterized protein
VSLWRNKKGQIYFSSRKGVSLQKNKSVPSFIGIISDTHGLVRPEALEALHGADLIIHAGDIGSEAVLAALRSIAPVLAVRGNNDSGKWADKLPATKVVSIGHILIYVLHDLKELDRDPDTEGFSAVVSGHSHKPLVMERDGVLFVNPGSAGPRRFALPVSVASLRLSHERVTARLIVLGRSVGSATDTMIDESRLSFSKRNRPLR